MARITGRFGTLSVDIGLGAQPIADLRNWTLDFTVEAVACPEKGEVGNRVAIGGVDIRITAERMVDGAGGSVLAALAVSQLGAADPVTTAFYPGMEVTYTLDQLSGAGGASITGPGYITRGSLNAPRDLATDTFEIVGTELPVVS